MNRLSLQDRARILICLVPFPSEWSQVLKDGPFTNLRSYPALSGWIRFYTGETPKGKEMRAFLQIGGRQRRQYLGQEQDQTATLPILGLAEGTVSAHVFHIKKKFDVHTRAHAVAKGFRCGLLA